MVKLRNLLISLRLDLVLVLLGWLGLIGMTRTREFSELVSLARFDEVIAFNTAILFTFCIFVGLTYRWTGRLFRNARRMQWDPETRAVSGTVMCEFALVLPIVLLLLGTVMQLALMANAALVIRYAAFVSARSAMVSFEADMGKDLISEPGSSLTSMFQMPPFPEFVDDERPENAAVMVLASISPRSNSTDQVGRSMEDLLTNNGDAWEEGNFAQRVAYARKATTVSTIRDTQGNVFKAWFDSFSPLIPEPEHIVQPARQKKSGSSTAYLLPEPPSLDSLFPDSIDIELDPGIFLPSEASLVLDTLGVSLPTITIPIPLGPAKSLLSPVLSKMDEGINVMRTGSSSAISAFARSPANIDILGPKEVEITLVYLFRLSIPSLIQLAPGVTESAPEGQGRAFRFEHPEFFTVRLQSTGGRRGLLGIIPKVLDIKGTFSSLFDVDTGSGGVSSNAELKLVDNTPLYFRLRDKEDDEESDDDKKKKKDAEDEGKKKQDEADKKKDDAEKKQKKKNEEKKKKEEAAKKKKEAEDKKK